ncbi:MAG TPA: MgtC/SapB family protein [Nannocystis sp.]
MNAELVSSLGVSLGVGLLIGLERQQAMVRKEGQEVPAGLRTFPLLSLAGSLAWLLAGGSPVLPAAGLVALVALLAMHRLGLRVEQRERGVTTEAAVVVAYLLGMLVVAESVIPDFEARLVTTGALGTTVALLLSLKPRTQRILRHVSADDLFATLQLLVVALVMLPLLPDRGVGPYGAINPAHAGRMILLIGGVSWIGFVAARLLGAGRGLVLTGLVGGLVSSTAVTFSMAARAREEPAVVPSCTVAIAAANAMMLARVLVAVAVVAPPLLPAIALPIAVMMVVGVTTLVPLLRAVRSARVTGEVEIRNPFELRSAFVFGILFAVVTVIAHAVRATLGDQALVIAGLVAGLTDVDAITLSTASLTKSGLSHAIAGATILAAVVSNTAVKAGIAFISGGWALGRALVRVHGATLLAGIAVMAVLWAHGW